MSNQVKLTLLLMVSVICLLLRFKDICKMWLTQGLRKVNARLAHISYLTLCANRALTVRYVSIDRSPNCACFQTERTREVSMDQ